MGVGPAGEDRWEAVSDAESPLLSGWGYSRAVRAAGVIHVSGTTASHRGTPVGAGSAGAQVRTTPS